MDDLGTEIPPPFGEAATIVINTLLRRLGGRVSLSMEELEMMQDRSINWMHNYPNDSLEIWTVDR